MSVTLRARKNNFLMSVADIVMPASYVTGGVAITPQAVGLTVIMHLIATPAAGFIFEFNHATGHLRAFTPTNVTMAGSAGAQGANNTIISVSTTAIGVSGTGPATNVRAAAIEVAAATNLSGVTVRITAIGY